MHGDGACVSCRGGPKRNNNRQEAVEQRRNSNVITTTNMYDNCKVKQPETLTTSF